MPRKSPLFKKKEGKGKQKTARHPATTSTDPNNMISIRVHIAHIAPVSASSPAPASSAPADPLPYLYLIEGTFEEIERYAGKTADWIVKVAYLICDPLHEAIGGHVYTHTTDTAEYWRLLARTDTWREVVPGDPLRPGIYEFHSASSITLSKISECQGDSQTPASPITLLKKSERQGRSRISTSSNASAFKKRIMERDNETCVVSGSRPESTLTASHLIPKWMGADGVREVMTRFCGGQVPTDIGEFDPRNGIALAVALDRLVDVYHLGFYHVTGNIYDLHNFKKGWPNLNMYGFDPDESVPGTLSIPTLHLRRVTLSDNRGTGNLPPPGVFTWHYLQCVIRAFGTPEYKNREGIRFFVHPFTTDSDSDDSDDQCTDIDEIDSDNPPWPSYHFDRSLREQGKKRMERERYEAVVKWSSEVTSSN